MPMASGRVDELFDLGGAVEQAVIGVIVKVDERRGSGTATPIRWFRAVLK